MKGSSIIMRSDLSGGGPPPPPPPPYSSSSSSSSFWVINKRTASTSLNLILLLVKYGVSFLLVGLAFRLLILSGFPDPSSIVSSINSISSDHSIHHGLQPQPPPPPPPTNNVFQPQETPSSSSSHSPHAPPPPEHEHLALASVAATPTPTPTTPPNCDIFSGDWLPDPSPPAYTNQSCLNIESHQNCLKNGRPDSAYLHWRWTPRHCHLPRFDPRRFLDIVRDKSWAFIGDSISRNHVQSLLCILSQVEEAVEVYHDPEFRSKRWYFSAHNFTLSVIWTPFLNKADTFEDSNGASSGEIQLHLDKLDAKWTQQYDSFDYATIAGGKWFLKTAVYYENDTVTGCHYCPGKNLTELGFEYAYRKALRLVLDFVAAPGHRAATVFFRTITPDHFENGEWFSGGTCNRTIPFKDGEIDSTDIDTIMRNIELEEFEKAKQKGSENGVVLKLLDTTKLSLLRPDGHPGPYRQFQPFAKDKNAKVQTDCLHWCLPGPIDSWNDLVMELLVNARQ